MTFAVNGQSANPASNQFLTTLQDMGVTAGLISEVMAVVESVRNDVLGK